MLLGFLLDVYQDVCHDVELNEEGYANTRYLTPYSGIEILVSTFMGEFNVQGYLTEPQHDAAAPPSSLLLDLLDRVWTRVPAVELEHPHWGLCFYIKRTDWVDNNKVLVEKYHFKHKLNTLARVLTLPDY